MIDQSEFDVLRPRHSLAELAGIIMQYQAMQKHPETNQSLFIQYERLRTRFNHHSREELKQELNKRRQFYREVGPLIDEPNVQGVSMQDTVEAIGELIEMIALKDIIRELPELEELVGMPSIVDQIINRAPPRDRWGHGGHRISS